MSRCGVNCAPAPGARRDNDTLDGGHGRDTMAGGLRNDTYIVDNPNDTIIEAPNAGIDMAKSSVSYTLAANVENLILTGTNAINGTGNALNNVIVGNDAANKLTGGLGADTLTGDSPELAIQLTGVDALSAADIVL